MKRQRLIKMFILFPCLFSAAVLYHGTYLIIATQSQKGSFKGYRKECLLYDPIYIKYVYFQHDIQKSKNNYQQSHLWEMDLLYETFYNNHLENKDILIRMAESTLSQNATNNIRFLHKIIIRIKSLIPNSKSKPQRPI